MDDLLFPPACRVSLLHFVPHVWAALVLVWHALRHALRVPGHLFYLPSSHVHDSWRVSRQRLCLLVSPDPRLLPWLRFWIDLHRKLFPHVASALRLPLCPRASAGAAPAAVAGVGLHSLFPPH